MTIKVSSFRNPIIVLSLLLRDLSHEKPPQVQTRQEWHPYADDG
jgi:hypothetical protein